MPELTSSDGIRLVYDDLGPSDGVPVVICHGLAATAEQMAADAAYFAGLGFRVLVPDLRGHGRSGKPQPITAESLSIPRLSADLVEILKHAGVGAVHWVGNSLGGILGLQLLDGNEHRLRTLATYGTAYSLDLPRWSARYLPLSYAMAGPGLVGAVTAWATTRNKSARPLLKKLVSQFDPAIGGPLAANLARYDLIANAQAARLPILMLRGGRDGSINAALGPTLTAMTGRPNFTLVELPEGGHCANLDTTEAWRAALLRFWQAQEAATRNSTA